MPFRAHRHLRRGERDRRFLVGWPSIIAVILNYVKRSDVAGTWLESHFRWQIRTFWFALLWVLIAVAVG